MSKSERFDKFHQENPHVYKRLVDMARTVKARGHNTYSMWALYSALAFEVDTKHDGDKYKLNSHYIPYYSRLIMNLESDLRGFFSIRRLRSA